MNRRKLLAMAVVDASLILIRPTSAALKDSQMYCFDFPIVDPLWVHCTSDPPWT
jgi:hypothetical protein